MDMTRIDDWLSAIPSPYTRKSYKAGIKKFEEFYGNGIETLIGKSGEEAGRAIEKFYVWLKDKGRGQNTCRNLVNSPIQFLKFFGTEPKYRKALGMYRTVPTTRDHRATIQEIQTMAKVADLRGQILLEVYLLGLRIGDVASLEWRTFSQDGQAPIPIEINTKKEQVLARTFVSEEFKELLGKYIPLLDKANPFLFQTARKQKHLSTKQIDNIFKSLQKRAGIVNHGLFRWHTGRKLAMRTAAELGVSGFSSKMLVGKSIPASDDTYVHDAELKNDFLKISEVLRLLPKTIPQGIEQIQNLENAVKQIESENMAFKTRIDLLQKEVQTLKKSIDGLYHIPATYPTTLTHRLLNKKTKKIEVWNETINTPEEMEASLKRFEEKAKKLTDEEIEKTK